ncbi:MULTISPECIES: molybdenum cofactor biosynthesis protein MoaE [unclassified Sphingomonas]|uniref:molybdenum cofactor biosynthesis protein MoaE n=1 Tax=unclassified Sphingomonas TaxID=196159 RepID=UPI0006F980DE|nr:MULTISPECIES: molybdenum cofactor biosynthesis protein MoaE [unclassified Sphingomonas]KQX17557.1 molybdopterin synthase catalytic subunit [Sphingomonas sp. Root1294]KQY70483.1 molybdopterin synthase catalytic subunit [Sphingomonas sp. Root50]KRB92031.1 molybdopterin synthase catalytic subunit [Sphingomonas sp. Root720]
MSAAILVRVQAADIDVAAELARLEALGGGGIASFTGVVRGGGGLQALELEHHPGITGAMMHRIAAQAAARWPLLGVTAIHRHGLLPPGERIVLVAAASPHRAAALEATGFLIDWLKTRAPFWKKEHFADGTSRWVEARAEDDAAAARWETVQVTTGETVE